jgi:hypothetical protein
VHHGEGWLAATSTELSPRLESDTVPIAAVVPAPNWCQPETGAGGKFQTHFNALHCSGARFSEHFPSASRSYVSGWRFGLYFTKRKIATICIACRRLAGTKSRAVILPECREENLTRAVRAPSGGRADLADRSRSLRVLGCPINRTKARFVQLNFQMRIITSSVSTSRNGNSTETSRPSIDNNT